MPHAQLRKRLPRRPDLTSSCWITKTLSSTQATAEASSLLYSSLI